VLSVIQGRRRSIDWDRTAAWSAPVTVRLAALRDGEALERLAGLDSRPLPPGPHLVAERDGRIEAALSLCTHQEVSDPFRRTAELRELLRCHAGGVRVTEIGAAAARPVPQPRLVPA
jgi:hypothetical protein